MEKEGLIRENTLSIDCTGKNSEFTGHVRKITHSLDTHMNTHARI